jgi:hypothetical protein
VGEWVTAKHTGFEHVHISVLQRIGSAINFAKT